MAGLKQTTAPTVEPVTLDEAKLHLRVDSTEDDGYISDLIVAAREQFERDTERQLCTATYTLKIDDKFPSTTDPIWLPKPPFGSMTSIQYVDTAGATQTLAGSGYTVDNATGEGVATVSPSYDNTWPSTRLQTNAITVTYTAGYGDDTQVPPSAKRAMLLLMGNWYTNRESVIVDQGFTGITVPHAYELLVASFRVWNYSVLDFI